MQNNSHFNCLNELQAQFGNLCNLNEHLRLKHNDVLYEWFVLYKKQSKNNHQKEFNDKLFELVKWFFETHKL